jgi:hypothetical protein
MDELKPALAIIEFIMPGLNGAEVARVKQPALPIIFVSVGITRMADRRTSAIAREIQ